MLPVQFVQTGPAALYGFGLALAAGALIALLLLYRGEKKDDLQPGSAPLAFLLSALFGLAVSRLLYSLLNFSTVFYDAMEGSWLGLAPLVRVGRGGHSLYGLTAGVLLGLYIFAKLTRQAGGRVLDWAAPALAITVCAALFAQPLGGGGYGGESSPLLQFFPASIQNQYGEWNTAVFMYQGLWALLLAAGLIFEKKEYGRPGDRMLRLLVPLYAMQIFFESLRQDDYPRLEFNAFIRSNQLLALIALLVILALLWQRLSPAQKAGNLLSLLAGGAVFMAAEFWEKLPIQKEALYGASFAMALVISFVWLANLRKAKL